LFVNVSFSKGNCNANFPFELSRLKANLVLTKSISTNLFTVILAQIFDGPMAIKLCSSKLESFSMVDNGTLEQAANVLVMIRVIKRLLIK
jgi:hypothetical protein